MSLKITILCTVHLCIIILFTFNHANSEIADELSDLNFDLFYASDSTITGPRCIPLKSKNIKDNPYHPSLLSRKGAEIRRGLGIPTILEQNPLSCPSDSPSPCSFDIDKSFSTTISNTFSVSLGKTKSVSKSLGVANMLGKSDSVAKSIGKSMEESLSKSWSLTDEESISDQITDQLTSSHEKASGFTKTTSKEVSEAETITQDISITNSTNRESGTSKFLDFFYFN